MNSDRNLLKRLIRLYPVKLLKEEFGTTEVSDALYDEIINSNNAAIIKTFAYNNIDYTKQHIYLYILGTNFNQARFNQTTFPFTIIQQVKNAVGLSITISPVVDFSVVLSNQFEETVIKFNQPTIVTINNRHRIIKTTILEKNIGTYFDATRRVLDVQKVHDEDETVQKIITYFANYNPIICDINRGIKYLWANDRIDSKYAKWKKNRSTTTEAMDENYTLKSQYPDVYRSVMSSPLNKTIFKYLIEDENFPDHFTADPTNGELSIPLYSKNLNQIPNVINEILSNN
jgi:hypothetical protein